MAHKHGVYCNKMVICGGMGCDVMAASQACCRQCVCVSAGIWRVKGLRLGAVGVERRLGGGGGEHPKWERVPHESCIKYTSFRLQPCNLSMWNCHTAGRELGINPHKKTFVYCDTHEAETVIIYLTNHVKVGSSFSPVYPPPQKL